MKFYFYHFFVLTIALYSSRLIAQQDVSVKKNTELKQISSGFRPVFVSSKRIVFTGADNNGLYLFDLKKKKTKKLCEDIGAGHHFKVSEDGKNIAYKSYIIDEFGRRQSSVYLLNIDSKKKVPVVRNIRNISTLGYQNNELFYIQEKSLKKYPLSKTEAMENQILAFTDDDLNLVVYKNGTKTIINPYGKGNYIWVSLSPDKQNILFTKTGKGTFVCDTDGKIIAELGRLHAAKWSKDGKWIIGMNDFDNGYNYTNSQIIMISPDGTNRQVIDLKDIKIALYPDLSDDNSKIVFNTDKGKIYILKLKYR